MNVHWKWFFEKIGHFFISGFFLSSSAASSSRDVRKRPVDFSFSDGRKTDRLKIFHIALGSFSKNFNHYLFFLVVLLRNDVDSPLYREILRKKSFSS